MAVLLLNYEFGLKNGGAILAQPPVLLNPQRVASKVINPAWTLSVSPAVAGGTDCVQQRSRLLEVKLIVNDGSNWSAPDRRRCETEPRTRCSLPCVPPGARCPYLKDAGNVRARAPLHPRPSAPPSTFRSTWRITRSAQCSESPGPARRLEPKSLYSKPLRAGRRWWRRLRGSGRRRFRRQDIA